MPASGFGNVALSVYTAVSRAMPSAHFPSTKSLQWPPRYELWSPLFRLPSLSKVRSGGCKPVELNLILEFISTDACNWPTRSVRLFRLANIDLFGQRVSAKGTDDDVVTYSV